MTDRIVLDRLGGAFAPAQKITPLKRESRDAHKRRFERHLMGDGESQEKDARDLDAGIPDGSRADDEPESNISCDDEKGQRSGDEDLSDKDPPPGSLVDIRV